MKHASYLAPIKTPATAFGTECAEKIKEILRHEKPAGNWWAHEIMSRVASGGQVSLVAYEMAKTALRAVPEREPGSDDE